MTLWHADPPQGVTGEQGLVIIGKPLSPRFAAPQGLASDIIIINNAWIDDFSNQLVDDLGNVLVFEP